MENVVSIIDVKNYVDQEITIGAWFANKSGKGKIAFLQLRDGTAYFQAVAWQLSLNVLTNANKICFPFRLPLSLTRCVFHKFLNLILAPIQLGSIIATPDPFCQIFLCTLVSKFSSNRK